MTNTQHNWHVGDPIIMTVDSGKGEILEYYYKDGIYEGEIIDSVNLVTLSPVCVRIKGSTGFIGFELDGSCSGYPGMSIRLAEEKGCECGGNGGYLHCEKCGAKEKVEPTPLQWIEGQIPDSMGMDKNIYIQYEDGGLDFLLANQYISCREDREVIRYCIIQLPPPPPVKEVEAYGFLEYCTQIIGDESALSIADSQEIIRGKRFYSQLATAENLNKYLDTGNLLRRFDDRFSAYSIDMYLSFAKIEAPKCKLLFTPTALDMLGVK